MSLVCINGPKGNLYTQDKIEGSTGKHDVFEGEALKNIVCPFKHRVSIYNGQVVRENLFYFSQ
jgi:hypothetical protein